jgi:hypothetical protein
VGWNDKAKMAQFYRGLKDVIKDELARQEKAETLHDLMEQAVRIDTRVYERSLEKGADINSHQRFTPGTYMSGADLLGSPDDRGEKKDRQVMDIRALAVGFRSSR